MKILFAIMGVLALSSCRNNSPKVIQNEKEAVYINELLEYRKYLDSFFKTSKQSPFYKHKNFKKLNFYEPDLRFRLRVKVSKIQEPEIVQFQTNTDRKPTYLKKYYFAFDLLEQKDTLWGFVRNEFPNSVFVPFKDLSNNTQTYSGGRYIDIELSQETDSVWLDFNTAYNPYCHYDTGYSCPVVPYENRLNIMIEAGEKQYK